MRLAEAAHAAHAAVVVVEGAVLLHEHDDVLDVLDRAPGAVGGDAGGAGDAVGEAAGHRGGGCGAARKLKEATTVDLDHGCLLRLGSLNRRNPMRTRAATSMTIT